ncbi:hypothetical protein EVAR_96116_1 [Eumeta japonica]|uniref:Uncharacterized protein n=1 Tax=Eumeta variegata TaxID=151549 RepID=A0A4C1VE34_EUMVA|nr:hypothetical protein EVAR_96116_1 [Eumeta japonica]
MNTRNSREGTSALLASWEGIRYLMKGDWDDSGGKGNFITNIRGRYSFERMDKKKLSCVSNEINKTRITPSPKFTYASARVSARVDFEQISLSYISTVYNLNPNPDFDITFDFDRSLAFNSEPDLGLRTLELRAPALISDFGTIPYSDSEHTLGSNFNSTLDSKHGCSRFRPHPVSSFDSVLRLVCNIDSTTAHGSDLDGATTKIKFRLYYSEIIGYRILFSSSPQEWMSDIWIRRWRFGCGQCSISEAASARNISSNIFACTAYCRGFITDERPRRNIEKKPRGDCKKKNTSPRTRHSTKFPVIKKEVSFVREIHAVRGGSVLKGGPARRGRYLRYGLSQPRPLTDRIFPDNSDFVKA